MLKFLIVSYLAVINYSMNTSDPEMYTIYTDGCKIPAFPLVSDSIQGLVSRPASHPNCSTTKTLLAANSTHIWVIKKSFELFLIFIESDFSCCYRNFSAEGNVENIAYGLCQEFSTIIKAEHEFVRVECYYSGSKIYEDLFRFKFFKLKYTHRRRHDDHSFNVLMLGLDSMSRKNFLRTMSRTSSFLKLRGSMQLYGYNKLGDNSFPNLFPMLTGKPYQEAKNVCWKNNVYNNRDCSFMWNQFKDAGFYTAMGADSGAGVLGLYESLLPFKPTDFYLQPFMYETRHTFRDRTFDYHMCLKNRYVYKELLTFIEDVVSSVPRGKLFGFFWQESVSHGNLNYPYIMDTDYYELLKTLEKTKYLEDSVVVMCSDHGTRWGEILGTAQGRQESRLPLFEVLFPNKFRRRYKMAVKNFEINGYRLTTAHDVYETLLDLIDTSSIDDDNINERIKNVNPKANGISLFLPIPGNRTCKTVDINDHWCTCLKGDRVRIGKKGEIFIAKYLLKHLNLILSEYPQCHKLSIDRIIEVTATKNKNEHGATYRMLLKTNPGGGVFEGTLVRERVLWTVSGTVSRLNLYGNQSRCIQDPVVKMYCYCKNNL